MKPIISYAQNFEDVILWRALHDVEDGFFIDIGAQSPVEDSVSLAFSENGWRGVHVEPNPEYARQLRQARPADTVIEAAAGRARGSVEFHVIPGTGLSTSVQEVARAHGSKGGLNVSSITVPTVTLDDLFAFAGERDVHWLKIDVEGGEGEVLEGWSSASRPWVVVVESLAPVGHQHMHHAWEPLLLGKGYAFAYFDGLNRFYVHGDHQELAGRIAVPPNVFDQFLLSGTASSTFGNLLNTRGHEAREQAEAARRELADVSERHSADGRVRDEAIEEKVRELVGIGELHAKEIAVRDAAIKEKLEELAMAAERHLVAERAQGQAVAAAQALLVELTHSLNTSAGERAELMMRLFQAGNRQIAQESKMASLDDSLRREQARVADLEKRLALQAESFAEQEAALRSRLVDAAGELNAAAVERAELQMRLFQANERRTKQQAQAQALHQQLHAEHAANVAWRAESVAVLDARDRDVEALRAQLTAVVQSRTWRTMKPLLDFLTVLRGRGTLRGALLAGLARLDPHGPIRRSLRRLAPPDSVLGRRLRPQASVPSVRSLVRSMPAEQVRNEAVKLAVLMRNSGVRRVSQ